MNTASDLPDVPAFLARYERATHHDDERLGDLFEPTFITGSPRGTFVVTREMLLVATATRRRAMHELGQTSTRLADVEIEWLGATYCLARTRWLLEFSPAAREPATLTAASDFLLQNRDGQLTIVTYLARQDIDAEVRKLAS